MKRLSLLVSVVCVFCVICGFIVPLARADAQGVAIIRGEVSQVDGATRAPGVVIVAVDTAGTEVARALSGSTGNYSLTVPAPARYVIRALRIGYRPTVLPVFGLVAGELRTIPIVLSGESVALDAVRVEGEATCRINVEAGRAVANLWDQARTALAASMLSAGGRPFETTLATYRQYTPRGERVVQAEVEGSLWLDRQTSELRLLDFRYVNLPRSSGSEDADGYVAFVRLLTGDWIIRRWAVRTPVTEERVGATSRFVPIATRVVGGVTRTIQQDGITLYSDPGASITIALRARDTVNRRDDAHVVLFGTEQEAFARADGTLLLQGLTAGRYKAMIWTPFMSWLNTGPVEREVDVRFDVPERIEVTLPTADEIAANRCGISATSNTRLVYGKVSRAKEEGVPRARVLIGGRRSEPQPEPQPQRQPRRGRMAITLQAPIEVGATTDEHGQWQLCTGLSGTATIRVVVEGAVLTSRAASIPGGRYLTRIDITVP